MRVVRTTFRTAVALLTASNPSITRAIVVVHGAGRDADNNFRHLLAAAFLGGGLDDTLIVSPRFASNNGQGCLDTFAEERPSGSAMARSDGRQAAALLETPMSRHSTSWTSF